jgi:hypothetical protein
MLSSSSMTTREVNGPTVTFKTPGAEGAKAKRRAFGDVSNRKPLVPSAVKNAGKAAVATAPPEVVKSTNTTATKKQPPTVVVPKTTKNNNKTKTTVSFELDDDDEEDAILEFPAGRLGKEENKSAFLYYLDNVFAELARDEMEEREEEAAAALRHENELREWEMQRQQERERDMQEAFANDGTCVLLLLYWCFNVMMPFVTPILLTFSFSLTLLIVMAEHFLAHLHEPQSLFSARTLKSTAPRTTLTTMTILMRAANATSRSCPSLKFKRLFVVALPSSHHLMYLSKSLSLLIPRLPPCVQLSSRIDIARNIT